MNKRLLISVFATLLSTRAMAQQGPGGPGGFGGGPQGHGPPSPVEMKQHMLDDIEQQLNLPDDQWKPLSAKIEKIIDLRRALGVGGPGRPPGGQGGQGGPRDDENAEESPVDKARHDLEDALDKPGTTATPTSAPRPTPTAKPRTTARPSCSSCKRT